MKNAVSAGTLVAALFVSMNLAAPTAQAGTGGEYSRGELMGNSGFALFRAADFCWQLGLAVYLDGIPITTLSRGEAYRAIVRPGHHVLTVTDTPSPYGKTKFTQRTVALAAGQNYSLTAIWEVETILLEDGGYVYHGFYR